MTDSKITGLRERIWNYGNLHGLRMGLNTATLYLEWANENPNAIPELLKILEEITKTTEEQYALFKAEAKQYLKDEFGEEEEDAEQQGQGEEV